jgi:acylphosphatase
MLVARRFVLSGRVQGVGFRYFVEEAAAVEGLTGWVQNLADGRVEAFAQGDREAVERFERKIRRGPAGARIDDVTTTDEEAAPDEPSGFRIRA